MNYVVQRMGWHGAPQGHAATDADAIRVAQRGDRDTFVQLIAGYDAIVFRLAWNHTQSAAAASDIYETVFTTAYRLLPSYTGEDSFLIWLFRIATRCCLAYSPRSAAPRNSWPGESGPDDARIPIRLRQALMQLSARDRLVFILRHEMQFKTATIARMLDADDSAVHVSLTRAFLMLRGAARGIATRQ